MSDKTLDVGYDLAQFTPVTVTAETLQVIMKQPDNHRLMALYMSYVEITTWQQNNCVKATTDFMASRIHWAEDSIRKHKKTLIKLGLLEDVQRHGEDGKIDGHFILVKHIVNTTLPSTPHRGEDQTVVDRGTSANNYKESANNLKENTSETLDAESQQQLRTLYRLYLVGMRLDPTLYRLADDAGKREMIEKAEKSYRLTPKRKQKLQTRLKDCGYDMCKKALNNISKSEFHRGDNDRKWIAHLEWVMGSVEKVEEWADK